EGEVAGGRFRRAGLVVELPVEDGPAILAVRPEALALSASDAGAARVHRVTDYGTHGLVDLDLEDGTRLKSMVSPPALVGSGPRAALAPKAVAAYRGDARIYRS